MSALGRKEMHLSLHYLLVDSTTLPWRHDSRCLRTDMNHPLSRVYTLLGYAESKDRLPDSMVYHHSHYQ